MIRRLRAHRTKKSYLATGFWCDKHWAMVEALGLEPAAATAAIAVGLRIGNFEARPTHYACCHFTDETVRGVLELVRNL